MGQLSQGSGLSGNTVRVTAALFVGVLLSEVVYCHMGRDPVDGLRLWHPRGGVVPEKCALSHGSGVLGRDPRDTVTQFRLGEGGGGGGGYHWGGGRGGGGSANREPGSYMPGFLPCDL